MEQQDIWRDAGKPLEDGELYLERTEKLLFRRLWEYIIAQNWPGARQVVEMLGDLGIV